MPRSITPALSLLFAICGLSSFSTPAQAERVNPYLRLLSKSPSLRQAFNKHTLHPLGLLEIDKGIPDVPAMVLSSQPEKTRQRAKALGLRMGPAIGPARDGLRLLPIRGSVEAILSLGKNPEVRRLQASPPYRPLLDLSRPDVRADEVEAGTNLPELPLLDGQPGKYDGTGVIAALVDSGLDYTHEDFASGVGRSRVLLLWDQAFEYFDAPEGYGYGSLCERDSLTGNGPACQTIDFIGHGTHVTATMAGSGLSYRGIAPGADLMGVAMTFSGDFTQVAEGVQWLFEQAEDRGQPMVVNLSLGTHYGPHDGTSMEAQAFTDLTGPGRIIVAAAGNEGDYLIHLGYDPAGTEGRTYFSVYQGLDVSAALFSAWLQQEADLEFAIAVFRNGTEVADTGFVPAIGSANQFMLSDGAISLGRVIFQPSDGPDPGNGKHSIDMLVEPSSSAFSGNPSGYGWALKVRGQGAFDAWSAAPSALTSPAQFSDRIEAGHFPGDNLKTIGMPAVAKDVIAVGAYTTRNAWTDIQGREVSYPAEVGEIAFFSSRGPALDQANTGIKPLIAAPGMFIAAALSNTSGPLSDGTQLDEKHIIMQGTSMACPHVAGVVALMLQVDPQLNPAGVAKVLERTARQDAFTGSELPDPTWGHGKVDAWEAVAFLAGVGLCVKDEECAEDYRCNDLGRCELLPESGCGCAQSTSPNNLPLLLLAALLLIFSSRRGW